MPRCVNQKSKTRLPKYWSNKTKLAKGVTFKFFVITISIFSCIFNNFCQRRLSHRLHINVFVFCFLFFVFLSFHYIFRLRLCTYSCKYQRKKARVPVNGTLPQNPCVKRRSLTAPCPRQSAGNL